MTIEERLVAGETVAGSDALVVMEATENPNWVFWTKLALAFLNQGAFDRVRQILEDLIDQEEEAKDWHG